MSHPFVAKYQTTNWPDYNRALKSRGSLTIWFDPSMHWYAPAAAKRGRPVTYSDAAVQFCLTIKVLYGLALRQTLGLVESLLKLSGLAWDVPDFSTLSRRQKTLQVRISKTQKQGALHLLVDSTGIKMAGEGEWKVKKHGAERRRQWRKLHLAIDAETLEIQAIEVTDNRTGDAVMLPELLAQIAEPIASMATDGAYDTKAVYRAIADRGANAIIPPRKNGRPWKEDSPGAAMRNACLRAVKRLGRAIWKKWSGYHRRSLVETKMHCFKLLADKVRARDFDRQVAELQIAADILNRFSRLGRPVTVCAG